MRKSNTLKPGESFCFFCGWNFLVEERHHLAKLLQQPVGEKWVDFCSYGCRIACVEKHVAFEERHVPWDEKLLLHSKREGTTEAAFELYATDPLSVPVGAIYEMPEKAREQLMEFLSAIIRMAPAQRDVFCLALAGIPNSDIARARGCSAQNVSQRLREARKVSPIVAVLVPKCPTTRGPNPATDEADGPECVVETETDRGEEAQDDETES